jgi:hypothetical protein
VGAVIGRAGSLRRADGKKCDILATHEQQHACNHPRRLEMQPSFG